jgi:ABC-type transporter Mla subunit MlaD
MNQIDQLETQIAAALDRLRAALAAGGKGSGDAGALRTRLSEVEGEKAALAGQLERLRTKRDKDVAALDELIAQLKPLIEEV